VHHHGSTSLVIVNRDKLDTPSSSKEFDYGRDDVRPPQFQAAAKVLFKAPSAQLTPWQSSRAEPFAITAQHNPLPNPRAPTLSNPHYKATPSIAELKLLSDDELTRVADFCITKYHPSTGEPVGVIRWLKPVDLLGVDITAEVKIVNEEDTSGKRKW
jgi:hypothetical protein